MPPVVSLPALPDAEGAAPLDVGFDEDGDVDDGVLAGPTTPPCALAGGLPEVAFAAAAAYSSIV